MAPLQNVPGSAIQAVQTATHKAKVSRQDVGQVLLRSLAPVTQRLLQQLHDRGKIADNELDTLCYTRLAALAPELQTEVGDPASHCTLVSPNCIASSACLALNSSELHAAVLLSVKACAIQVHAVYNTPKLAYFTNDCYCMLQLS